MHGEESRVFHYAVLASIVMHGLMLFGFSMKDASRRAAATPQPIVARLVQPPAAPAKPEPVAPPRVEPQPPAVKPTVKPTPSPKPVAKAAPTAPAQPAAPSPTPPAAEPAPPSAAPAPAAAAAPQSTAPVARPGAEVDADSLGRFRMQVIEAALRFKRYPRVAMDNNWEGVALVRLVFGADGKRASVTIARSSGHEILDRQALDTMTKAFVPVPASLRGKEFTLEIPVMYNLKDNPSG
jgi:periplasmic protein TonB